MTEASEATGERTEASEATGERTEASEATGERTEGVPPVVGRAPDRAVSPTARPRLARHVRMSWDRTRERHVLLLPETVVALNPTGADVLALCDGERTVAAIVSELHARYERVVDDEVDGFLARLAARRCVEIVDER